MSTEFKRATGVIIAEVVNSNPNGGPDEDGDPRQRSNGLGEISPPSVKRKARDLVDDHDAPVFQQLPGIFSDNPDHYCILESRGRDRSEISKELKEGQPKNGFNQEAFLNSPFVQKYWDARVFGNTYLEGTSNKGFVKTGVVHFGLGLSVAPINIIRHTLTNKAGVEEGKNSGMAPLSYRVVEHGVYVIPFYVNPNQAHLTGCDANDIELLKTLLPHIYELNRSLIRTDIRLRHVWYIEHKNLLGSCPDYLLLEALTPERLGDPMEPSQSWKDYKDKSCLPDDLLRRVDSCIDLVNC